VSAFFSSRQAFVKALALFGRNGNLTTFCGFILFRGIAFAHCNVLGNTGFNHYVPIPYFLSSPFSLVYN